MTKNGFFTTIFKETHDLDNSVSQNWIVCFCDRGITMKKIKNLKGNPLLLFINSWSIGMTLDRNPGLILSEFGRD